MGGQSKADSRKKVAPGISGKKSEPTRREKILLRKRECLEREGKLAGKASFLFLLEL